ncbi:hypothetical protein Cgig2_002377 [Carnegiea gigantea]|uniref:Neprosin PEP catalytic domain-containing protein n=1 Tax=Carnegiea gigantea TaxID=171969 RepID=A0A9Q1KUC8_9CARY|nr:hypothetical protein Cgig2_002377 [Carnegiea gigantea]
MDSMKIATNLNLVHGLGKFSPSEEMELEKQLKLINKPAIKSFVTEYGDILDCIPIDKQLAFDHPLLKNHSIQMRPSSNIHRLERSPSRLKATPFLPRNKRCPKGTVVIKRVNKEDLLMAKFLSLQSTNLVHQGQESSLPPGHQVATLSMPTKNVGILGTLNVWGPKLAAHQFSIVNIFVASSDGSINNAVAAGWFKDSGKSTGCFNVFCSGFVQVSRKIPIGIVVHPLSTYGGSQYEITLRIIQDDVTGDWWLRMEDENVGYYPKNLFTTLGNGATAGGWGGEIYSSVVQNYPPMGSGHFPEEGFRKACFIDQMKLLDPSHSVIYPDKSKLQEHVSMPKCYRLLYVGDLGGDADILMAKFLQSSSEMKFMYHEANQLWAGHQANLDVWRSEVSADQFSVAQIFVPNSDGPLSNGVSAGWIKPLCILLVFLTITNLLQGLVAAFSKQENLTVKQQLNLLNKPAVKSFQTEYGDILDCVEINKQLAFDHPLLKNHSIQMKPSKKKISKEVTSNHLSFSEIILLKVRCPPGTVPIKRTREEDLIAMEKFRPSIAMKFGTPTSSKSAHPVDDQPPQTDHIATVVAFTKNYGVTARINIWSPEVKDDHQFTSASVFVASDDGSVSNAIAAGWSDETTQNWWLTLLGQVVGYWPKELFSTLTQGATRAGWGGEVNSPVDLGTPAMGSGHFPIEGFGKACFIRQMRIADDSHTWVSPSADYLKQQLTNPLCFNISYDGSDRDQHWEYGDILDCIEIDKQLAFDHPSLKNHTIQMKPSSNIQRLGRSPSRLKASQFLPKNIRCPKGTVLIKRVQKEDLLMAKFIRSSSGMKLDEENDVSGGHKVRFKARVNNLNPMKI